MLKVSFCDAATSVVRPSLGPCVRSCVRGFQHFACVHSRGHIFDPIFMKVGQNVCIDDFSAKCENGLCWVKN